MGKGEKGLLCDPGSQLRLAREKEEENKRCEYNRWGEQNEKA